MTKRDKSRQKGTKKLLRDAAVMAGAVAGKTTSQIAAQVGITRQTVSQILNSDEIRQKAEEIDGRLTAILDDAIECIHTAVKSGDWMAAREVLRNFGAMRPRIDITQTSVDIGAAMREARARVEARFPERFMEELNVDLGAAMREAKERANKRRNQ